MQFIATQVHLIFASTDTPMIWLREDRMIDHLIDGCACTGKWCPNCEQVKCRGAFDRSLRMRDGLQPYCRECRLAKRRESRPWLRDDYKEANRKKSKQWRQDHPGYGEQHRKAY